MDLAGCDRPAICHSLLDRVDIIIPSASPGAFVTTVHITLPSLSLVSAAIVPWKGSIHISFRFSPPFLYNSAVVR